MVEQKKRGGKTKILRKGVQTGSRGGCLEKGEHWNPITNCGSKYAYIYISYRKLSIYIV